MINIAGKDFDESELATLAKAGLLQIGQKNDPASLTLNAQALNGPFQGNSTQFGAFSYPGVRPQRFSALARPDSWINIVPVTRSQFQNEIVEILTGQTAGSGNNASGWCGDPPMAGGLKTCQQLYTFGEFYEKTALQAAPAIGLLRNRADVPGEILNAGPTTRNQFIPDIMYRLDDTQSALRGELFKLGVDMERNTELVSIQGVAGTQSNTYRGWMTQFAGIDRQIKTGYTDAVSGYACQAADSAVIAYNAAIDGTSADGSGRNFIETVTETYRGLKKRAKQVGMGGTVWALVMRSELAQRAYDVWACQYATARCTSSQAGTPVVRDGEAVQNRRLEMMRGEYLLIDGEAVPVITSEGIPQEGLAANSYKSDIYIVPINWQGTPLIRLEYFPMDNQYISEWVNNFGITTMSTLNNGMFLVGHRNNGFCLEWLFAAKMRMILETPFLAGRVDDVSFSYYEPTRQAIPGASLYVNGGISYRS